MAPLDRTFDAYEPDPIVRLDGNPMRTSALLPILRSRLKAQRMSASEADEAAATLIAEVWQLRKARGGLFVTWHDIVRAGDRLRKAKARSRAGAEIRDRSLRGELTYSDAGVFPESMEDPRPGPLELAAAEDMRTQLHRAVSRDRQEFPSTRDRAHQILDNAPHSVGPHRRESKRLGKGLLRKCYKALFGEPGALSSTEKAE